MNLETALELATKSQSHREPNNLGSALEALGASPAG